jgi:hypothetical protein
MMNNEVLGVLVANMTDEILGFAALIACLIWSFLIVWLFFRGASRKVKNDPLDNDLHW